MQIRSGIFSVLWMVPVEYLSPDYIISLKWMLLFLRVQALYTLNVSVCIILYFFSLLYFPYAFLLYFICLHLDVLARIDSILILNSVPLHKHSSAFLLYYIKCIFFHICAVMNNTGNVIYT